MSIGFKVTTWRVRQHYRTFCYREMRSEKPSVNKQERSLLTANAGGAIFEAAVNSSVRTFANYGPQVNSSIFRSRVIMPLFVQVDTLEKMSVRYFKPPIDAIRG